MADMDRHLENLVMQLRRDGSVLLPHPSEQPGITLFTDVNARLQDVLGDKDFTVEMKLQEGGSLITLKVGDAANEAPDFAPPEPRLL